MGGKLIVISGPSGAGKTTLYKRILKDFEADIGFSVSATTRPPRSGERDGVDYFFIDRKEFEKRKKAGWFVETATVHGNLYGTPKSEIDRILGSGRNCLLDIDVQGSHSIRKLYPEAVHIFIMPPSVDELIRRLTSRATDAGKILETRIANAIKEMEYAGEYSVVIVNDDLEKAYLELKQAYLDIVSNE
jgi:guanylate kinase